MQDIIKIIAELQANPQNLQAYRNLIKYYYTCNKEDEAKAFEYLIEKKYGSDNSNIDKK